MFEELSSVTSRRPFCAQCNVRTNLNGRVAFCAMTPTLQDVWTEEKCIQLIREFRARPVLWDPKHPFFYKKAMKPDAWNEVGEIMNVEPDACKQKMIVLMSSFRREKAKIMHSIEDSQDDPGVYSYKSTWFAFKEMAFLMDKENERKRQLTGEGSDDETPSIKKVIMQHVIQTPIIKGVPQARCPIMLRKNQRRTTDDISEESVTPPPASVTPPTAPQIVAQPKPAPSIPGPSQTRAEREEEIQSFLRFIGNKMKRYSDVTKNSVQQAICETIFKADQNQYESSCYEKYTIIDSDGDPLDKISFDTQNGAVIKEQLYTDSE